MNGKIIAVSGGFDPFGDHHLDYIKQALELKPSCLVCIIMSDKQLIMKKGKVNIPEEGRKEILDLILKGLGVPFQVCINHYDNATTLIEKALEQIKPDVLFRGGDKSLATMPVEERMVCERLKIGIRHGAFKINRHGSGMIIG